MSTVADMGLLGGGVSLDFVNTVDWRTSDKPVEMLGSYEDVLVWAERVGILKPRDGKVLQRSAEGNPRKAHHILMRMKRFRELLYRIYAAYLQAVSPTKSDIREMNRWLRWMSNRRVIVVAPDGSFQWDWTKSESVLYFPFLTILRAATELMFSNEIERLQQCEGNGCGWLFLDSSRNHTRRWCSMKACGNRAKARNFYHRKKRSTKRIQNQRGRT